MYAALDCPGVCEALYELVKTGLHYRPLFTLNMGLLFLHYVAPRGPAQLAVLLAWLVTFVLWGVLYVLSEGPEGLIRGLIAALAVGAVMVALYLLRRLRPQWFQLAERPPPTPSPSDMLERLVDAELRAWGGSAEGARARVEARVRELAKQRGLSLEGAARELHRGVYGA